MRALNIAVIADSAHVQRFALEALDEIHGTDEITVYSCTNTHVKRRLLKHAAYYALSMVSVRSRLTRFVSVSAGQKRVARIVPFEANYDGAWQALPRSITADMTRSQFDVVLKLGMGLLRVPSRAELRMPILSFHHGDPDHYRGRPAGFWEMYNRAPVMGQVVQVISNRLDAGQVVAYGETKVHPRSYRATLAESYRHSRLLMNAGIRNALDGTPLRKPSNGPKYRLPSNAAVMRMVAWMAWRFASRLVYGALVEKRWHVSLATVPASEVTRVVEGQSFPRSTGWQTLKPRPPHVFYADPFFSSDPSGVLVDALNGRSGLGEILLVDGRLQQTLAHGRHYSYPSTIELVGQQIVVPEIAKWSPPRAYVIEDRQMKELGPLRIENGSHVIDPTLVQENGRVYLFGNKHVLGRNALFVWLATSLAETFIQHPMAPVRISPLGSRMAGGILRINGRLVRLGQDVSRRYGDGILVFQIHELSETSYRESLIGEIRFSDRRGPHTLNVRSGELVFDWYRERLAPLAGLRRVRAHLAASSTS